LPLNLSSSLWSESALGWCALGNVVVRAEVGEHNFIMVDHQFAGTVLINGQPRKLDIRGNPMDRTVVQVDGVTVYDERRVLQKEIIDFQIIPGKGAQIRCHRGGCDIFVDNKITTLASLAKDGTAQPPVAGHAEKMREGRAFGAGMLALAAFSFWLNRSELISEGQYYPKALSLIPPFVVIGTLLLAKPEWADFSPKDKVKLWGTGVATILMGLFGYTIFTDWFIGMYGH
jgi:hypothetical protein